MLFDLRGKRRRTVQATYLTLAVLMGAGLVLFGIGSSTNGGLGDLFNGGSGSNKGSDLVNKQITAAEKTLATQPGNRAALAQLVKGHYQLATVQADQNGNFLPKAGPELVRTTQAWNRYLDSKPATVDIGLASYAVQAYDGLLRMSSNPSGQKAYLGGIAEALGVVAQQRPSAQAYVQVAQYANAAGQADIAKRATNKAISLAPKQKKQIQQQANQQPAELSPQPAQPAPVQTGGK